MELSKFNPIVILLYFISNILITMLTKNPVFIIISFSAVIIYSLVVKIPSKIVKYIILIVFIIILSTITNPLFNNLGETVMFKIGKTSFSYEALMYGFITSLMLISIILWFRNYNLLINSEKFLYIFSRYFPNIALIISMTLKLIPEMVIKIKDLTDAQRVTGIYAHNGIIKKLQNRFLILGNLFSWTIEHSLTTAISMKARGYGLANKTHYVKYKFKIKDILMTLFILTITILTIFFNKESLLEYSYYPTLSLINISTLALISYILFFVLANLATLLHIKEKIKWHNLKSRI